MVVDKKWSTVTRHSPRFADTSTGARSVARPAGESPTTTTDPSDGGGGGWSKRRRLDGVEVQAQCQELIARRLRRLHLVRDERQQMAIEDQYYRESRSALTFTQWVPEASTQNAAMLNAEIDTEGIERRLLGAPMERRKTSVASSPVKTGAIRSPRNSLARSPVKGAGRTPVTTGADEQAITQMKVKVEPETTASVLIASFSNETAPSSSSIAIPEGSVERAAKQEAQVLARINELRRQGLWSASKLPLCVEPARNKTHWDFLLEEVRWMHMDFQQERRFKRILARKLATQIARLTREREVDVERSEQRAIREARRVSSMIARMVRDFWTNVDKVVDSRAQEMIEAKKRAAMDQHLDFIVGQADKLSSMVQQGLANTSPQPSETNADDREFRASDLDSDDDETTIAREERRQRVAGGSRGEISALQAEADIDMDELISQLPAGYLENFSRPLVSREAPSSSSEEDEEEEEEDEEEEEEMDEEEEAETTEQKDEEEEEAESKPATDALISQSSYAKLRSENSDERQQELTNIAEQALALQPKGYTLETTQVKTPVPFLLRGTLREYQHVGLDWLVTLYEKNLNGILADEMGLGKTIQTIALLAHLACRQAVWGPHLIVVPTSVLLNWEMELKKWCPAFKLLTYFGSQKERLEKRRGWSKPNAFHICITSYKIVTQDIRAFKARAWEYFILDEAQHIKNFKSQRWQLLLGVRARHRLLLTGTPLQNSLMELWSLMHFLMPAIFTSHMDFREWFANPLTSMVDGSQDYNAHLVQRLHKVLRPFILRRFKCEVEKQLPQKVEHVIKCPLSRRQRFLYDDFITRDNLRSGNAMSVLNIVMQLRKCCNHPNLFEPRPVISPLSMNAIRLALPSIVLAAIDEEEGNTAIRIPPLIDWLSTQQASSRLVTSRRLIEEIDTAEPPRVIPKVEGFRFLKPSPTGKMNGVTKRQDMPNQPLFTIEPDELASSGLHRDGDFWLHVNEGETSRAPLPMHLHTDASTRRMLTSTTASHATITTRDAMTQPSAKIFHLIRTSAGTRTISASGNAATRDVVGNASTSKVVLVRMKQGRSMITPALRATTVVAKGGVERLAVAKHEQVVEEEAIIGHTPPFQQVSKEANLVENIAGNSALRLRDTTSRRSTDKATAIINGGSSTHASATSSISPSSSHVTASSRSMSPSSERNSAPPAKRLKLEVKSDTNAKTMDPLSKFILDETKDELSRRHLECLHRLATISEQRCHRSGSLVVAKEVCSVLSEICQGKRDRVIARGLDEGLSRMREWRDRVLERFMVFVHAAVADCPRLEAVSTGLPAFRRQAMRDRRELGGHLLRSIDSRLSSALVTQKISFPELRLIEYDCGKLQALSELLHQLSMDRHRCLIFTQMARMLDVLQAFLSFHGYQYFRLDGSTSIEQRQALMERFNADERIFCFILSTRSGGLGVNLTGADTVIFYDSDWNPTMDAQAQDRCHRIGQTRDVHIYRLISERTIEENILNKANQKRRLGEVAIDEAGFTPQFFRVSSDLRDLFDCEMAGEIAPVKIGSREELENTLARLEDEQDAAAAVRARVEANSELMEFEGTIAEQPPTPDSEDAKYLELLAQLKPIERYAINFLEAEYKPDFEEELKETALMFEQKKDEWVRRAQEAAMDEDDDDQLTYLAGVGGAGGLDEMVCCEMPDELMPTWMPPSPPSSEHDLYMDHALDCLYESDVMTEERLPSVILDLPRFPTFLPRAISPVNAGMNVLAQHHHSSVDDVIDTVRKSAKKGFVGNKGNEKREAIPTGASAPQSRTLFDPSSSRNRSDVRRTLSPPPPLKEDEQYEGPEWTIVEDYALLLAITEEQQMTYNLLTGKPGHVPNWDYVSGLINRISGYYRSPRQCSLRYQLAVLPREEGRLVAFDPVSKKPRKVHLSHAEVVHMKRGRTTTTQQFETDGQKLLSSRAIQRFRSLRSVARQRTGLVPFHRCNVQSPTVLFTGRLPVHQDYRLSDLGIRYATEISPRDQAEYRDERRARQQQAERERHEQMPKQLRGVLDHSVTRPDPGLLSRLQTSDRGAQPVPLRQSALPSAGLLPPPTSTASMQRASLALTASTATMSGAHAGQGEPPLITALVDHHQMQIVLPPLISRDRLVQGATTVRRQPGPSMVGPSGQSSYAVVASIQDPSGMTRMQYTNRSMEGATAYRAIVPQTGKPVRTPPSTPAPIGYVHQVLPTAMSSGNAAMYANAPSGARAELGESSGLQLSMRPQLQPAVTRQTEIRPKTAPQRVNRVILTTTAGAQQGAYIVPQPILRGQRIVTQKRASAGAMPKPASGNVPQPVTTLMLQSSRGGMQQMRSTIQRHQLSTTNAQPASTRIPPIGLLMSSSRNDGQPIRMPATQANPARGGGNQPATTVSSQVEAIRERGILQMMPNVTRSGDSLPPISLSPQARPPSSSQQ